MQSDDSKICCACRELKPFSEFQKRRTTRDGLTTQCKTCTEGKRRARLLRKGVGFASRKIIPTPEEYSRDQSLLKTCKKCGASRPRTEFFNMRASPDGKQPTCKPCNAANFKAWVAAHPDRAKELKRLSALRTGRHNRTFKQIQVEKDAKALRSEKACKKCGVVKPLEEFTTWSRTADGRTFRCLACLAEYNRKRYWKDPQEHMKRTKRWQKKYPEKQRHTNQLRRVRKKGVPGSHTHEEWIALCRRFKNRCVCCGSHEKLTKDHVVPITNPNCTHNISNIQPLCYSCNSSKGNHHATDYRMTPFTRRGQVTLFG